MVVGLSNSEWRLLFEKVGGSDRMQMISGVEEAVVRGLSQSEGTPDAQTKLKNSWNAWAIRLCAGVTSHTPSAHHPNRSRPSPRLFASAERAQNHQHHLTDSHLPTLRAAKAGSSQLRSKSACCSAPLSHEHGLPLRRARACP